MYERDTIAAIASPPGTGAIALLRLSRAQSLCRGAPCGIPDYRPS